VSSRSHADRTQSTPVRARYSIGSRVEPQQAVRASSQLSRVTALETTAGAPRAGFAGGAHCALPTSSITSTKRIRPPQFEHSRGSMSKTLW